FLLSRDRKRISPNVRDRIPATTRSSPDRRWPPPARKSYPKMGNDDGPVAGKHSQRLAHAGFPGGPEGRPGRRGGRGRAAGMADAGRPVSPAWGPHAVRLPAVWSEPRRAPLHRWRLGLSRLSRSRVSLPTSAALLSCDPTARDALAQARACAGAELESEVASRENRTAGSVDACEREASCSRCHETEAVLCPASWYQSAN